MRRIALFALIAVVAYFSYPFMQPAMSLADGQDRPERVRSVEKGEFIKLAEASSRLRREAAAATFDFPDPKPEAVFTVAR